MRILLKLILFMVPVSVIGQMEQFDIATFTAPGGWERSLNNGVLSFMDSKTINDKTSFCQILIYPSSQSTGDAGRDFKDNWNRLVTAQFKVKPPASTQTNKRDGWTIIIGASNLTVQNLSFKSILINLTGFGKTMAIQMNTAGGDYTNILEKFIDNFQPDAKLVTKPGNTVGLSEYLFTIPEGWIQQSFKDYFQLQSPLSGCTIKVLSPQAFSGNLEKDTRTVFATMYNGWNYQNTGEKQYTLSKGTLASGWEFFMMEASMAGTDADGHYNLEEGAALLVKVDKQVVIISVRHNSSLLAHGECRRQYNTWRRFFNSFSIKNREPVKNRIPVNLVGVWSQTESGASSEYVFAANGNYAFVGALGSSFTSSDYQYEYLHIKTYSFKGDGTYSNSGNRLILKKQNLPASEMQVRIEDVNYGGKGWTKRIWLLSKDKFGLNEVCYDKKEKS